MKQILIGLALIFSIGASAQNVGIGTPSPNVNAKLDITATDKGLLIPRMDSIHRKAIPNTVGLLVYDTTTKSFWYNNGAAWQSMAASASAWSLTGNGGATDDNVLGTRNNKPLNFITSNAHSGKIDRDVTTLGRYVYSGGSLPLGPRYIVAIGDYALANAAPLTIFNTAVGSSALRANNYGDYNTAVGALALTNSVNTAFNTAVGANAMQVNTTGNYNTAVGFASMQFNQSGNFNTAVGFQAEAGVSFTNATAIGANAGVDASNKIRLGDGNVTVVESNGAFNTVSDGRFKYNIHEDVKGLDFIMQLRPVTYQFDTKKQEEFTKGSISAAALKNYAVPAAFNESNSIKRTGFIAQEVEAAAQKTGFDFDGVKIPATDKQYYSLSYASFVVPLVKAMQEQQQIIDALKKQNEILQKQNEAIIKRLEALEKK